MNFKKYSQLYNVLEEMPYVEFGDMVIDLEAEKKQIVPRIIDILIGNEVKDKYGNVFKLKSDKEMLDFFKLIKKDKFIAKFLKKALQGIGVQ